MSQSDDTLLEHRDDVGAWSVYADARESSGELRAPLMSLMLAREARPSPALASAQAEFFAAHKAWLVPPGNHTLVWRRGFVTELHVGHRPHDRVEAAALLAGLLPHDSLRFLDALTISQFSAQDLATFAGRTLPCRRLKLTSGGNAPADLSPLMASFPRLEWLELKRLSASGLASRTLRTLVSDSLATADLSKLTALEQVVMPEVRREVTAECEALSLTPWWPQLQVVHVRRFYEERHDERGQVLVPEAPGEAELGWLSRPRPKRLVVGFEAAPEKLPADVRGYSVGEVETAFVVTKQFGDEERRVVANFARMSSARGFALQVAEVPGAGLSLCRVFGAGVSWGPRAVAEVLARRGAERVSCFIISQSNSLVRAWTSGGALEEFAWEWVPVARRVLEGLHGFDPGLALEPGLHALDLAPLELLVGDDAQALELLTELEPAPVLPRDEEDNPITDDAMALTGADVPDGCDEDDYWAATVEDEPEVDEPVRDAVDATVEEVLGEGPVEWNEAWEPDLYATPEELGDPALHLAPEARDVEADEDALTVSVPEGRALDVVRCGVCARVVDVDPCVRCAHDVCLACSVPEAEDARSCFECAPLVR